MGSQVYYRSLMNLGNANYLAYKSRVLADGGAIIDDVATNSSFQTLDDLGALSSLILGISKDAGNKITSSKIEKAYSFALNGKYDCSQTDPSKRPTSDYDFAGVTNINADISNTVETTSSTLSWFFRIGSTGVLSGIQRLVYNGGDGPNQASNVFSNTSGNIGVVVGVSTINTTTALASNKSYLVVFNGTDGNIKVYVDGVLDSTTATSEVSGVLRERFTIAAYKGNQFGQDYNGEITSAYVWDSDQSGNAVSIHNNL